MFSKTQDSFSQVITQLTGGHTSASSSESSPDSSHGHHQHRHGSALDPDEIALSQCNAGDILFIRRISGKGPVRRRLLEMGLNPGTELRIVKYAPLKDPIECVIKGYHIALRVAEAHHVVVSAEIS
jgi:Fur family transcriptional regulator, ferric uptake regulator